MTTLSSPAQMVSWDEDRSLKEVPRLTPAAVKMALPDLHLTITSSYQMVYLPAGSGPGLEKEGSAVFIFTDRVDSTDEETPGSFMTQGKGMFMAATYRVEGTFEIIAGSGQGKLGERFKEGKGSFASGEGGKVNYVFELK
ncbi:hypothetical protein ASPZODRAFT_142695 [Penicilliopsis zonata CBS 506.65]|uniref:DUF3224 domain-containing protein n=1 Tax=Penicilliopsis zonata CBS 506.65 TaxID=1073090 RepID=A0A1L9SG99_9EURO|nr:hypothetical protein ASPZODRAFT_142695 [Penicilliopsis zonata CBS 506.65]OJJ46064.1 hypothetical protein ASPZODRAFT_142695 [Penicilliopsis zonata CBS 506.65]